MSSKSTDEEWAIASGVVQQPGAESKPSTTPEISPTPSNTEAALQSQAPGEAEESEPTFQALEAPAATVAEPPRAAVEITVTATVASASQNTVSQNTNETETTGSSVQTPNPQDNLSSDAILGDSSQAEASPGEADLVEEILLLQDDLTTAQPLESPEFSRSGSLAQNAADLYQFSVEETGVFTATLGSLSADADVQLIQDKNANGQVDAGEIVAWEWERSSEDESIRHFLQTGNYWLRVIDQDLSPAPTDYGVTTTFRAAETDDRAFSINVVYQRGSEDLNDSAREAVESAADYWENVISHSSFDRPLEFALGLYGTTSTTNPFLAYAGPFSYLNTGDTGVESSSDKLLPIVGVAVLNNFYLDEYNSNPDYLESVLRHEIGHALGLGVLWDQRGNDLVDQDRGLYRAETYAGQSYGDLLGTGIATEIPLDQESLTHWDEDIFDAELLTPQAEGIGEPLPLSPLTASSLRDIGWHVNYGAAEAFSLDSNAIA